MQTAAQLLIKVLSTAVPRLRKMSEAEVALKPAASRWSRKEILGHLIDSACNNHQRFVRAQLEKEPAFPGYDQDGWVRCQGYATAEWSLLVDIWSAYNRHISAVIKQMSAAVLSVECRITGAGSVTLGWLVEDYLRHLDHHLEQIIGGPVQ